MGDQNKNTEQLRELLKQKLTENAPADNGWNVPSTNVWSGLSEELHADKHLGESNGRMYLFAAISLALLTVLFVRECSHNQQIEQMKTGMESLENSYFKLKENCDQHSSQEGEAISPPEKINQSLLPVQETEMKSTPIAPSPQNQSQQNKKVEEETSSESEPFGSFINKNELMELMTLSVSSMNIGGAFLSRTVALNSEADKNLVPKNIISTENPPILPSPNLLPLDDESKVDLRLSIEEEKTKSLVLLPSIYAAVSLTGNRMTGEQPAIISNQKALPAYRSGIGLEAVLSRHWSVQTGLQYSATRTQTDYQLEVAFTHENEYFHEDGNVDNQYNHSLPSSMGNYPAQFVLTRADDAIIHEGEIMNLDLSIRQRTQFLSLPLHLRYGFGKSRLRAGVKAGLVANRTLSVSSESPSLVSNHSEIHQRHTSVGDPLYNKLEKNTLDVSFGIDLRYQVAPRIGVSLESNYQRGITPIYQDETVKNYLDAANLGFGLHFLF